MSRNNKINDQDKLYFFTFTVINWIDVFIRNEYRNISIESIQYCQKNKGLNVYAWCLMTSHAHLIVSSEGQHHLQGIIRDLRSFTSRQIRKSLEDKDAIGEGRREWMYNMMTKAGIQNSNNHDFQFCQQHNQHIQLHTRDLFDQK